MHLEQITWLDVRVLVFLVSSPIHRVAHAALRVLRPCLNSTSAAHKQIIQDRYESRVVIGLTEQAIHNRGKVDLAASEKRRLIVAKFLHQSIILVVEQKLYVRGVHKLRNDLDVRFVLYDVSVLKNRARIQQILLLFGELLDIFTLVSHSVFCRVLFNLSTLNILDFRRKNDDLHRLHKVGFDQVLLLHCGTLDEVNLRKKTDLIPLFLRRLKLVQDYDWRIIRKILLPQRHNEMN